MKKVIGIIAEYNPFHNGHIYQINKKQNEIKISKVMTRIYELKIIQ